MGRIDGEIVCSFYAIRRAHAPGEPINWDADSGFGTGSTHDENGTSLFSISCTVSRRAPKGCYRKMMEAWKELAKRQKVKYIYAGSRAVGLSRFDGAHDDYLHKVRSGEIFDPVLSKAKQVGFSIGNLIPGYFEDPESLDYGVEIYQTIQARPNTWLIS